LANKESQAPLGSKANQPPTATVENPSKHDTPKTSQKDLCQPPTGPTKSSGKNPKPLKLK